jgi:hypothetical protein
MSRQAVGEAVAYPGEEGDCFGLRPRNDIFDWCPNCVWTPNCVAKLSFATRIHAKWEVPE